MAAIFLPLSDMATLADAQTIANITAKQLKIPKPIVLVGKRLEAFTDEGVITIPEAILSRHHAVLTYGIVHEVCHFVDGGIHHGKKFRAAEDKMLDFWNISVKRKGVYPTEIRSRNRFETA